MSLFPGCMCRTRVNINQDILKKEWNFRKLKDCTYIPEKANPMPGRESTLIGGWMRLVENGGYQHIMQLYTKVFFLSLKMPTPSWHYHYTWIFYCSGDFCYNSFHRRPRFYEIGVVTSHYYQGLLSGKSHLELFYTKGFLPTAKSPSTKGDKNG